MWPPPTTTRRRGSGPHGAPSAGPGVTRLGGPVHQRAGERVLEPGELVPGQPLELGDLLRAEVPPVPGDLGQGQRLRRRLHAGVVVRVVEERVRQLGVPEQRVVPAHAEEVDHPAQRRHQVADQVLVAQLQVAAGRATVGGRSTTASQPAAASGMVL